MKGCSTNLEKRRTSPINLFKTVKAAVTTLEAAKLYGVEINRAGMARCPFHEDHTPSLKLDERYYCFGCQETGDVIDFTAKLFGISKSDAARKLAGDFGITTDKAVFQTTVSPKPWNTERFCLDVLRDYLRLLQGWKLLYAPQSPEDRLDDRFVEACQMLTSVTYLSDALTDADLALRKLVVEILLKDGMIYDLQTYVERKKKEDAPFDNETPSCA